MVSSRRQTLPLKRLKGTTDNTPVVKYLWYSIWIQLACIVHLLWVLHPLTLLTISLAVTNDVLAIHRFQLAIVLAIAEVFAVYGTEFIFSSEGALIAVGVGWLLLAMVDVSVSGRQALTGSWSGFSTSPPRRTRCSTACSPPVETADCLPIVAVGLTQAPDLLASL
jgi:hypothetical protein